MHAVIKRNYKKEEEKIRAKIKQLVQLTLFYSQTGIEAQEHTQARATWYSGRMEKPGCATAGSLRLDSFELTSSI